MSLFKVVSNYSLRYQQLIKSTTVVRLYGLLHHLMILQYIICTIFCISIKYGRQPLNVLFQVLDAVGTSGGTFQYSIPAFNQLTSGNTSTQNIDFSLQFVTLNTLVSIAI